jgi:two-component sensor histidine kinase
MLELSIPSAPSAPWLLVAEIEHRTADVLASAVGSISLAASRSPQGEVKAVLAQVARRLQDHSDFYRALQAPNTPGPMELLAHLERVCAATTRANLNERGVHFQVDGQPVTLDATRCWLAGLIMAELFVNVVNHASPERRGLVTVEISRSDGEVKCRVRYEGDGAHAMGGDGATTIVDAMVAELGGEIHREFETAGAAATLSFPELPAFGALSPASASQPLPPFRIPPGTEDARPGVPL